MHATPQSPAGPQAPDVLFKRLFIIFTTVGLAAAYGWLAGFVRQPNGSFLFEWRWLVLPWVIIGLASTIYFWRKIWPPYNRPPARLDIVKGCIALLLPGLWWMIFPLRHLSGQHLRDVITGLVAAAIVLSFGAWMIIRLGRAFESDGSEHKK